MYEIAVNRTLGNLIWQSVPRALASDFQRNISKNQETYPILKCQDPIKCNLPKSTKLESSNKLWTNWLAILCAVIMQYYTFHVHQQPSLSQWSKDQGLGKSSAKAAGSWLTNTRVLAASMQRQTETRNTKKTGSFPSLVCSTLFWIVLVQY
jgi:hypothetical protein